MERRLPVSKPLLLMLIGLIIGASLGLGSGYAVFYPNMVRERSETIEGRVIAMEDSISEFDVKLTAVNQSVSAVGDSLEGILTLTDVISQIADRVAVLEGTQDMQDNDLADLVGSLNALNNDFDSLTDDWNDVQNSFSDLESTYESAKDDIEDMQDMVGEIDSIRLYTRYMSNPSDGFIQDISESIYNKLYAENDDFVDWVDQVGANTAKIILEQEIDALMGGLVWNPSENKEVSPKTYQTKLETFFLFEFTAASITVNKIHLEVRATVNIGTESISQKTVSIVEII